MEGTRRSSTRRFRSDECFGGAAGDACKELVKSLAPGTKYWERAFKVMLDRQLSRGPLVLPESKDPAVFERR
jgi:hypothetical protein